MCAAWLITMHGRGYPCPAECMRDRIPRGLSELCRLDGPVPISYHNILANTRHSPNAGTMLGQRRRWWLNIVSALGECLVLTGILHDSSKHETLRKKVSVQCWASVEDDGPTLYRHRLNVFCLLGCFFIVCINHGGQRVHFKSEISINVLVSSFCFI